MITLQSLFYRWLYRLLTRGRVSFGPGAVLLRPELLQIERGGRLVVEPGAVIARNVRIVVRDSVLRIGRGAYVGPGSTLIAYADVTIGARVLIGERVSVHSEDHGPVGRRDMFCVSPVVIGEDAWICAGTVISKGAVVGAGTTVGANSFVRGELPAHVLAAGAPARTIRPLDPTGPA
jgi:acetyltransferase-like isoleucine patch superfamily enzyme